ncbi:MAG: TIGR00159 family protein [Firmicutes bacterium]|nr:TIGR00159 family protein [Bacillota bacterium]
MPSTPSDLLSTDTILIVLDIVLVAYVLYKVLMFIRGTRGMQLLKGFVVLVIFSGLSNLLHLQTVGWLLDKMWASLFVAIPVVFQPELRRALEQLGRGRFFSRGYYQLQEEDLNRLIDEIVKCATSLSQNRVGALIVIQRKTGLNDLMEGTVRIDGLISAELLINLFSPKSPLHDGAVVISGDRIIAAGALLPLCDDPQLSKELGTRHRASIGLTENTDALVVVVSEETGVISLAEAGRLSRYLDPKHLRELLRERLQGDSPGPSGRSWFWRSANE